MTPALSGKCKCASSFVYVCAPCRGLDFNKCSSPEHAEPPTLPPPFTSVVRLLGPVVILEIQTVPHHAPPVILESNVPFAWGHYALWHDMTHEPAAHTPAGGIDSRILHPPSRIAGPVVGRLRWQGMDICLRRLVLVDLCLLDGIFGIRGGEDGKLKVRHWLLRLGGAALVGSTMRDGLATLSAQASTGACVG